MDKVVQTLALCRRAGKLVMGFDAVHDSAISGKARVLAFSEELSPRTRRAVLFWTEQYHLPFVQIQAGLDELWYILGKRVGVFSVIDQSLAGKLITDAADAMQNRRMNDDSTEKV